MDEDEAALLAELRAISMRSSSASRFADDDPPTEPATDETTTETKESKKRADSPQKKLMQRHGGSLPPWMKKTDPKDASLEASLDGRKRDDAKPPAAAAPTRTAPPPWRRPATATNDVVAVAPERGGTEDERLSSQEADDPVQAARAAAETAHHRIHHDPVQAARDAVDHAMDVTASAPLPPWTRPPSAPRAAEPRAVDEESPTRPPESVEPHGAAHSADISNEPIASPKQVDDTAVPTQSHAPHVPPWKRRPLVADKEHVPPLSTHLPQTFQGDRGGAAEDAELLALLRGVSSQSSSRFDEPDEPVSSVVPNPEPATTSHRMTPPWKRRPAVAIKETPVTVPAVSAVPGEGGGTADDANHSASRHPFDDLNEQPLEIPAPTAQPNNRMTPPWKRTPVVAIRTAEHPVDVLVPTDNREPPVGGPMATPNLPKTFQGDRGGTAEDAELLALLRGVSNQSASRFDTVAGDEPDKGHERTTSELQNVPPVDVEPRVSEIKPRAVRTPPWRKKPTVVVEPAVEPVDSGPSVLPLAVNSGELDGPALGIKSDIPSTFHGERGGSAEDAELLALLRGVSMKSAASRFDDAGDLDPGTSQLDAAASTVPVRRDEATRSDKLPPWKRPGNKPIATQHQDMAEDQVDSMEDVPRYGIKSNLPSTFKGDRGGSAEDAELLALLRDVSSQSGKKTSSGTTTSVEPTTLPSEHSSSEMIPFPEPSGVEVGEMSRDDVPKSLADKNWKVRCQAFDVLISILKERAADAVDLIESDSILEGLDERIPSFVEDGNASALDKALEFANLYAEYCRGAGDADRARKIVSSLVRKNALSSRPASVKLASALALKLMEVGFDGSSSVRSVVDLLLTEGLTAKKPKVVQAAATLILEASYHFGAATLPIASVNSAAPKWLTHSNAMVRDCCLKVLAEICRVLGSKTPIQSVIDTMKKAQYCELESQLTEQAEATPIRTGLRSSLQSGAPESREAALAALESGTKELEAQRYASRPPVNLFAEVAKTDYATQIALTKWSEKVAALDKLLECGGEKPYKLVPPSSSINYGPLIVDTKKLLSHTHFAVCSKAIQVLSMLAEGVGEKLFAHLRPALTPLIQLSKDKKLTNAVSSGLDALFGTVLSFESLLDADDSIPAAVDEKLQKNGLTRATALEFLLRCVERNDSAGPKGKLNPHHAVAVLNLCILKLDDSDSSVRKASISIIDSLVKHTNENIAEKASSVIATLQSSNPRAFKVLSKTLDGNGSTSPSNRARSIPPTSPTKKPMTSRPTNEATKRAPPAPSRTATAPQSIVSSRSDTVDSNDRHIPRIEDALMHIASLRIPLWDSTEDEGGILVGLRASKWQLRHDAIECIRAYVESGHLDEASSDVDLNASSILLVVREQTRGFKESNVNIMKAILQLFVSICEYCESKELPLSRWAVHDASVVCAQKISDKKLTRSCQSLLTSACVVSIPSSVLLASFTELESVKSPVAHEEFLKWFQTFCNEFGASALGADLSSIVPYLIKELGSLNAKVKREATASLALLHRQIGPGLKGLAMSLSKQPNMKDLLQKCFDESPFDSSTQFVAWPRVSVVVRERMANTGGRASSPSFTLDVPKTDLLATLPPEVLQKLGSKDGKTAWKFRKEAMDEIEASLKNCNGLLETGATQMKQLAELMRGLRDRLSDTQINLRPSAARIIGSLLSVVDKTSQAKLGRLVFAALVSSAMNDIKKPMRDAALASIRTGIAASSLDGGGLNALALEALVSAIVSEVNEAAIRAGGLPDLLSVIHAVADSLPNLDDVVAARGQSLGEKYAAVLVECLTSSKSDTRSAALSLLEISLENGVVCLDSVKKATERLKPALQRSVGPLIAKMAKSTAQNLPTAPQQAKQATEPLENSTRVGTVVGSQKLERRQLDTQDKPDRSRLLSVHDPSPAASQEKHPLVGSLGKQIADVPRGITWPEYPEEPNGSIIENLKRFWAPFLPPATIQALFPSSGIKKQDDAKPGIDVLTKALLVDRTTGTSVVKGQVDLVLKWLSFALCSKESTIGLQDILALLKDFLLYMKESRREFTDAEALEFIPLLLDKAAGAKGRFRDVFIELKSEVEDEALLPPKRLCSVCVLMIDSSQHAKARAQACHSCIPCVEKAGLAGMGKRGVLATAKLLSQETTMYRAAALDLMEVILSKMNGDVPRLVRICGPNLSDKAKVLLEERWHKSLAKDNPLLSSQQIGSPVRRTHSYSPQKSPRGRLRREPEIFDELPKLSLREGGRDVSKSSPRTSLQTDESVDERFTFTFMTRAASPSTMVEPRSAWSDDVVAAEQTGLVSDGGGAAAALRARLLKIRDKVKTSDMVDTSLEEAEPDESFEQNAIESIPYESLTMDFKTQTVSIRKLLEKVGPIRNDDSHLDSCIKSLKMLHAAVARPQNSTVGLSADQLSALRSSLQENVNTPVELLRRLIGFAIHSGQDHVNAGMLLPLLSLCLATLMALFRDEEFSTRVCAEELSFLVRETATALLDARLSSSDELHEDTRTQMVRAINKLAVQAATGSLRHVAFQALMTLQHDLCLSNIESDDAFTSRLSRVVTKLFVRVIKAEEATEMPYSQELMDVESIVCSLEDMLTSEKAEICIEMAKLLVRSMIASFGTATALQHLMVGLGIDQTESALAKLVVACTHEADPEDSEPGRERRNHLQIEAVELPPVDGASRPHPTTPSRDVASLVSRLGSAPQGSERESALEAIRVYKATYGGDELDAHLQQLSGTFREFIEDQIKGDTIPPPQPPVGQNGTSVSERIRNLRSRLQATELSSHSAPREAVPEPISSPPPPTPPPIRTLESPPQQSKLAKPSPSKLAAPIQSRLPTLGSSSAQSLRDRLASRQTARTTSDLTSSNGTASSSIGRAAVLRARLEAVKQQTKQQDE